MNIKEKLENCLTPKEKGDLFGKYILETQFPSDYRRFTITDGPGDGGIDCFLIDDTRCWVGQFKYGESFKGCDTIRSEVNKFYDTLQDYEFNGNYGSHLSIREFLDNTEEDKVLNYVFGTVDPLTEKEEECLQQCLDRLRIVGFSDVNLVKVTLDDIVNGLDYHTSNVSIKFNNYTKVQNNQVTGFISLGEILNFHSQLEFRFKNVGDLLFEKNVRIFLGKRAKVNKEIIKTVVEKPETLRTRNLGITILTRYIEDYGNGSFNIKGPSICNGAQTYNCILEGLKEIKKNLGENKLPLNSLIKVDIIKTNSDEEDRLISHDLNSSSKVKPVEVMAKNNESNFKKLLKKVNSKYKFNIKPTSVNGIPGVHEVLSSACAIIGNFHKSAVPTLSFSVVDDDFGSKLYNILSTNVSFLKLSIVLSRLEKEKKLTTLIGRNKYSKSKLTTRGSYNKFSLIHIIARLIFEHSSNADLRKEAEDYIKLSSNIKVSDIFNPSEKLLSIVINIIEGGDDFIDKLLGISSKIFYRYAFDPSTSEKYLYKDYKDLKGVEMKGVLRDYLKSITGKNILSFYELVATTIDNLDQDFIDEFKKYIS